MALEEFGYTKKMFWLVRKVTKRDILGKGISDLPKTNSRGTIVDVIESDWFSEIVFIRGYDLEYVTD